MGNANWSLFIGNWANSTNAVGGGCIHDKHLPGLDMTPRTVCICRVGVLHHVSSSLLGLVDLSFRALAGRLQFLIRRRKFMKNSLPVREQKQLAKAAAAAQATLDLTEAEKVATSGKSGTFIVVSVGAVLALVVRPIPGGGGGLPYTLHLSSVPSLRPSFSLSLALSLSLSLTRTHTHTHTHTHEHTHTHTHTHTYTHTHTHQYTSIPTDLTRTAVRASARNALIHARQYRPWLGTAPSEQRMLAMMVSTRDRCISLKC